MLVNKICIGTVQFGIPYGINNSFGIPTINEIISIFKSGQQAGINTLDTANAYGDAEFKLGEFAGSNYKVITKFSKVTSEVALENEFKFSLKNLKKKKVYGYLAHSGDTLISNPNLWLVLKKAKEEKKIKKIGYSLYSPEQLEKLLDLKLIPDLVQLPYSLLDRKFESYFPILKKLGTEIHVRSVFLQGLYFMNPLGLPSKLDSLKGPILDLHDLCKRNNTDIGSLAINYAISNPNIDKVVVGIDSLYQLKENIKAIQSWKHGTTLNHFVKDINVEKKELLNPANW